MLDTLPTVTAASLFEPASDGWLPTELARGPWSPDALHGGPVAALLAGAAEQAGDAEAEGINFSPGRITVDLMRPVPLQPLALEAHVVRPGRKVQLIEARLRAGSAEVARAALWRVRTSDIAVPDAAGDAEVRPSPPEEGSYPAEFRDTWLGFHNGGVEHRFVSGMIGEPGPAVDWIRLRYPVVPDRVASPLQRVVAAADFGNGVSSVVAWETHAFINPELTVHLLRPAVGEWVCVDAVTRLASHGMGLAESVLWDQRGRIGRAEQVLLVESMVR